MADAQTTLVGNCTRDPELRFTASGMQVTTLGLAVNNRRKNNQTGEWEEETSFVDVTCFGQMAENVAESCTKGSRVLVTGRLRVRTYDKRDGGTGVSVEVVADEIGPSLRWATAQITRNERREGGYDGGPGASAPRPQASAPAAGYDTDEEPF
ncbi:MAG: single-stranded DNA-binding protein [Acidimicrobiales bacterium]|jgi:single-strand DNA-binding protein|nr:single-stranded DNA-binding protein [Acidimicrobiales bacterium]